MLKIVVNLHILYTFNANNQEINTNYHNKKVE